MNKNLSGATQGTQDVVVILAVLLVLYTIFYIGFLFYKNYLMKKEAKTGVILEISLEKDSEQNPFAIEQLWTSFHGLYLPWHKRIFKSQPFFSFEIKSENTMKTKQKNITFNIWVPEEYKKFVVQRVLSIYPAAEIKVLKKDYIPADEMLIDNGGLLSIETAELGLAEHSAFSLKTFTDFDVDPLSSVTAAMTDLDNREVAIVQLVARPMSFRWRKKAERVLTRFEKSGRKPSHLPEWTNFFSGFLGTIFFVIDEIISGIFFRKPEFKDAKHTKTSLDGDRQKEMGEKTKRPPFSFQIRILVATPYDKQEAQMRVRNMIASFNDFEGPYNGLQKEFIINKKRTLSRMRNRHLQFLNNDDVVSTLELAGLAHLPNKNMKTPGLKKILSKKQEAPINLSDENSFAVAEFRDGRTPIGLDEKARMRHIYVTGMTGVGNRFAV
ncbi:hypothetical protein [Bacillus cereus group sp. TH152-1LC]|uniref:hypothetical protein n=1 Tax=Bacillus cereus group sp. TH152-1LC TaxID=3018060 RepID=UPI0022E7D3C7|nr:hypothetical protein [Bacillus cereus group sp. TH152-1LC]MDA1674857.1 hypothetical protein [Bacillus cereus group sp. TH152-1LC]